MTLVARPGSGAQISMMVSHISSVMSMFPWSYHGIICFKCSNCTFLLTLLSVGWQLGCLFPLALSSRGGGCGSQNAATVPFPTTSLQWFRVIFPIRTCPAVIRNTFEVTTSRNQTLRCNTTRNKSRNGDLGATASTWDLATKWDRQTPPQRWRRRFSTCV